MTDLPEVPSDQTAIPLPGDAVPIVEKVARYYCPFCRRGHSKKAAAVAHIGRCWLNPENRTCRTCTHLDEWGGDDGCEVGGRHCSCAQGSRSCAEEVDLGEYGSLELFPQTDCPLWRPAGGEK